MGINDAKNLFTYWKGLPEELAVIRIEQFRREIMADTKAGRAETFKEVAEICDKSRLRAQEKMRVCTDTEYSRYLGRAQEAHDLRDTFEQRAAKANPQEILDNE